MFKRFNASVPSEAVVNDTRDCQEHVHERGRLNGVAFDAAKEHFLLPHHRSGGGESFKLLGTKFDIKLVMEEAVSSITKKRRPSWRLCFAQALLQPSRSGSVLQVTRVVLAGGEYRCTLPR